MCSHLMLTVLVSSLVSLSEESIAPTQTTQQDKESGFVEKPISSSIEEFYQLYQKLIVITLVLTGIIFISVLLNKGFVDFQNKKVQG